MVFIYLKLPSFLCVLLTQRVCTYFEGFSVDGLPTVPCPGRVSALYDEFLHSAVEDGPVVVSLQTQLDEVTARLGGLLRPQLYVDVTDARVDTHL